MLDNDFSVVISDFPVSMLEGNSETYEIKLSHQPFGNVVLTTTSLDTDVATITEGGSLTFTTSNWNTTQDITVRAEHDTGVGNDTVDIRTTGSGSGMDIATSTSRILVMEDETPGLLVTNLANLYEEGFNYQLRVRPTQQPTGDVSVAASSEDVGAVNFLNPTTRTLSLIHI